LALNLGVLVSGNGTNLQAILDAVARGALDARVRCVVSNKSDAPALERAQRAGVPALSISHKAFATREAFDEAVLASLREHGVEWVVLAGFMRVITPSFLRAWGGRVLNVHPALLPSFPGVNALGQALAHGVKVTGCTVHFVDEGVDSGPIIAQRAVPVLDGDDEATLGARVHEAEHELLVSVLGDVAAGRVGPHVRPARGGST
jgi:phosphoribosylglycinamide formyltransferase-1